MPNPETDDLPEVTNEPAGEEPAGTPPVAPEVPEVTPTEPELISKEKADRDRAAIQSALDRQIAELRADLAARDERSQYLEATVSRFEQERVAQMDPDERIRYEAEAAKREAAQARAELEKLAAVGWAVDTHGIDINKAKSARSPIDLYNTIIAHKDEQLKALADKVAEYERTLNVQNRQKTGVDAYIPSGGSTPNWEQMSPSERLSAGIAEYNAKRR